MIEKIKTSLKEKALVVQGNSLLCAVSGGKDSMVLLHAMHLLQKEMGFQLACVHFDHMLREQSAEEGRLVEAFCKENKIDFFAKSCDIMALGEHAGGLEAVCREKRYQAFWSLVEENKFHFLVTGHHMEDQAETVLLNILRGASTRGLRGMAEKHGKHIRPMLTVTKEEIDAYSIAQEVPYLEDESNLQRDFLRNKIRLDLLPALSAYNPNIKQSLVQMSSFAKEDEAALASMAAKAWQEGLCYHVPGVYIRLSRQVLEKQMPAIFKRVLRMGLENLQKQQISAFTLLQMQEAIVKNSKVDLGEGIFIHGKKTEIELYRMVDHKTNVTVEVGKKTIQDGFNIQIALVDVPEQLKKDAHAMVQYIDYETVLSKGKLTLRTFQKGDRFSPFGSGEKSLADYFIDEKIPRPLRTQIPLLFAGEDICWVVGYNIASWCKVSQHTKRALQLTFEDEKGLFRGMR